MKKIDILTSELIRFCDNAKHIILYGAGRYAKVVFDYLQIEGHIPEACIISGEVKDGMKLLGRIPVFSAYNFDMEEHQGCAVIFALQEKYHDEAERNVREYISKDISIFRIYDDDVPALETAVLRIDVKGYLTQEPKAEAGERDAYDERIRNILEKYGTVELSFVNMQFIGNAVDWIKCLCEFRKTNDCIYRLLYPITFPHMKLKGANQYMLKKFCVEGIEMLCASNLSFWSYFYRRYEHIFTISDRTVDHNKDIYEFNMFALKHEGVGEEYIRFTDEEEQYGREKQEVLGIDSEYVCFCIRETAYRKEIIKQDSPIADLTNKYRNSDPIKIRKGIERLKDNDYCAVRMGAYVSNPLEWDSVIDYAYKSRSEFLDLYLISKCRFFVSNVSGVQGIAQLFSKPLVAVNAPILTTRNDYLILDPEKDIAIFKKYWVQSENRFLSFREMLDYETDSSLHEIAAPGTFMLYERDGIIPIENTAEEIDDAIQEMIGRLNGTIIYDETDKELQDAYRRLLEEYPMKDNFPFGWRIGAKFLRENEWLLK